MFQLPHERPADIAGVALRYLKQILAIDSQSREGSTSIPTTPGQLRLRTVLQRYFAGFGYETELTALGSLMVAIPPSPGMETAPKLAFSCHIDTSEGTRAVRRLYVVPTWNGGRIRFARARRLNVSLTTYPSLEPYLGQTLVHGPGDAPIGLDDKLGVAELMVLAQLLYTNYHIPHGELLLVFRPDEEVNGQAVAEELAELLSVRHCDRVYTVDGTVPFETNLDNFNASQAMVRLPAPPLQLSRQRGRKLTYRIQGVKSHGATAFEEGYRNAVVLTAHLMARLGDYPDIVPVGFATDPGDETAATVSFLLRGGNDDRLDLLDRLLQQSLAGMIRPYRDRGASIRLLSRAKAVGRGTGEHGGLEEVFALVRRFVAEAATRPVLSEESQGWEGYSNPYYLQRIEFPDGEPRWELKLRLRAFSVDELRARERDVTDLAERVQADGAQPQAKVEIKPWYQNVGPLLRALPAFASLLKIAHTALAGLRQPPRMLPSRGGAVTDPFIQRSIACLNLGTGSWGIESGKELTSLEVVEATIRWLLFIVQAAAS